MLVRAGKISQNVAIIGLLVDFAYFLTDFLSSFTYNMPSAFEPKFNSRLHTLNKQCNKIWPSSIFSIFVQLHCALIFHKLILQLFHMKLFYF